MADDTKPKRAVKYNEDAVLCPACMKRIRLNNNGRVRTHMAGKMGSDKCMGSNANPYAPPIEPAIADNMISLDVKGSSILSKEEPEPDYSFLDNIFSEL